MVIREQERVICSAPINFWSFKFIHRGDLINRTYLWDRASRIRTVKPQQMDLHIKHTHIMFHSFSIVNLITAFLMERKRKTLKDIDKVTRLDEAIVFVVTVVFN